MTEGGKITDPYLGEITLYREFLPQSDEILYTTFFYRNGVRCRNEHRITRQDLNIDGHGNVEGYVRQRIIDDIDAGNYTEMESVEKMIEVEHDNHWPDEQPDSEDEITRIKNRYSELRSEYDRLKAEVEEQEQLAPVLVSEPSETELVVVSLLMRLYDVQMALLSHIDKNTADKLYDLHNVGGHQNPEIFIPSTEAIE